MVSNKISIIAKGPILNGSISTAESRCGKQNCACKADPPALHGPYYRWTGVIAGKNTNRTISKETAIECERRIENYRSLQKKIDELLKDAVKNAPWMDTEGG